MVAIKRRQWWAAAILALALITLSCAPASETAPEVAGGPAPTPHGPSVRIQIDATGNAHLAVLSKNADNVAQWHAPGGGAWLVVFWENSPFTEDAFVVPSGRDSKDAVLRPDVEVDKEYKYTVYNQEGTIVKDPMVRIDP